MVTPTNRWTPAARTTLQPSLRGPQEKTPRLLSKENRAGQIHLERQATPINDVKEPEEDVRDYRGRV